jgi:hypothetical protein
MSLDVVLEFVGALGILVPFALFQLGRMSQHGLWYLAANAFGSVVLTVVAWLTSQWGFLILQGVWALAAFFGIVRWLRGRRQPPADTK